MPRDLKPLSVKKARKLNDPSRPPAGWADIETWRAECDARSRGDFSYVLPGRAPIFESLRRDGTWEIIGTIGKTQIANDPAVAAPVVPLVLSRGCTRCGEPVQQEGALCTPCQRELARIRQSMSAADAHNAAVDAERERIAALNSQLTAETQRKADEQRLARETVEAHQAEQRAAADAREPAAVIELAAHRSVKGRPRVDCIECGKRHYVRVNGCGARKAAQ